MTRDFIKMKKLLLISALTFPLLTGCVVAVNGGEDGEYVTKSSWQKEYKETRNKIANLAIGEQYSSVIEQFGTPNFSESFKKEETDIRVLFYATHSLHSDGKASKDECTPLVFKNGVLQGWGEASYKQIQL